MKTINNNSAYINLGYDLTPLEVFELRLPKHPYQTDNLTYGIKPFITGYVCVQGHNIQGNQKAVGRYFP